MRKSIVVLPLVATAALVLAFAAPASAATTGDTPVTFDINPGVLSITVPIASVSLPSVTASVSAQSTAGNLGTVTVYDARGGTTGWTTTAIATDFVSTGQTILASSASYTTPDATVSGTATVTESDLSSLATASAVQTATAVNGGNTASWDPTITVQIPANARSGTYDSTVTHSVS